MKPVVSCLRFLFPLFVAALVFSPVQAEEFFAVLFKDTFQKQLEPGWQWVRENPEAHRLTEKGLEIKIEPGGLMGGGADAKNILVRSIPDGADHFAVVVETHHHSQFEQAGLILYTGDNDYVKLVHEHVDGETGVVLVVENKAQARVLNHHPSPAPQTKLLLRKTGSNQFTAYAAKNQPDAEMIKVSQFEFPLTPNTRIGVFTQSGQPNADRWAVFSAFTIGQMNAGGSG